MRNNLNGKDREVQNIFATIEKEIRKKMIRMVMKILQPFSTKESLLIAHGLWQLNYQILFIILQKKFIKLN